MFSLSLLCALRLLVIREYTYSLNYYLAVAQSPGYRDSLSFVRHPAGRGGSLVDSSPFVRRVVGLNPALAAT